MSSSARTVRFPAFVAAAAVSGLALAACSGGSDNASTAAPTTSSPTSTTALESTTSTPSATTTSTPPPTSTTTATSPSTTPKPTATTSTTPPPSTAFINACVTANSKLNTVVSQWNAAVSSGNNSKLDAAAKNFTTTATQLLALRQGAGDRQFSLKVQDIASELGSMATARKNNKTVTTTDFNAKVTALRTYCQSRLKA
ncbi:hypothetical protein ATK17_3032 [Branchiibius hedensis]|uniref:Lipoprotein n=1 Tax=Branchiibius hedensis TaxID=672460 RepID=A0A2Y8ZUQ6_9MICO|nr:hypothetical protein [Branchiibius hedensis]PWJ26854.1 hypothetical protein ATK17_3032 [Branchiibius hedensis]SSA35665.1 hypothetical protein SAMN04489750_3032 [Branchiibius hedensis]